MVFTKNLAFHGVHKKACTSIASPSLATSHQRQTTTPTTIISITKLARWPAGAGPLNHQQRYYKWKDHLAMAMLTAEERELLERGLQWSGGFKQRKRALKVLVRRFTSDREDDSDMRILTTRARITSPERQ
jgi:hypothetical protein